MFLRQLDLTTALRPSLHDDETLLFVQDSVGLYEGKFKIPNYQNGQAYLTSHRVCYVDNEAPRKYSVAVNLKEIERVEHYAGFMKSSPKITLFPKATKRPQNAIKSPTPRYASPSDALVPSQGSPTRSYAASPAPAKDINATWICPICGFSNPVPQNFDPATANQNTPLPPCQACGIRPPLVHLTKAAIAAMSNRPSGSTADTTTSQRSPTGLGYFPDSQTPLSPPSKSKGPTVCPRCTFENHPSLTSCEICGAALPVSSDRRSQLVAESANRPESPGPTLSESIIGNDTIETIKFSFRASGDKPFLERLRNALVQRKWLLQSAPPVPRPPTSTPSDPTTPSTPTQRIIGIAGLERAGLQQRQTNQSVLGTAFSDLEALMTSAKEVIAMAESFRSQQTSTPSNSSNSDGMTPETRTLLSDPFSALGLTTTTRDTMSASAAPLYLAELARDLAEFLTDDRRGVLRAEGGILSLVDLWAVFNRTRNGIELVSPLDFEKAARLWESLHLPLRLRRFKSGLLVVQDRSRTDEKTVAALLAWLREPVNVASAVPPLDTRGPGEVERSFGRGVTAQETAERFGWSVGVAAEELEMAEDLAAVCRDQCLDGVRFWENCFGALEEKLGVGENVSRLKELSV